MVECKSGGYAPASADLEPKQSLRPALDQVICLRA
jgi:hypothetical protein